MPGEVVETAAPVEPLRRTASRAQAYDWALVLLSEGIAHELRPSPPPAAASAEPEPEPLADAGWELHVEPALAARAEQALVSWEAENAPEAEAREEQGYGPTQLGLLYAALIVGLQLATGPQDEALLVFQRGSAEAARILAGEWWRCATALTLHADTGHALGNAVCGWFLLDQVSRRVGPALAAWLALASGIAGNLVTAALVRAHFVSLGASTAVFGALGALTALQLVSRRRRGWLTLGAGVALLGLLGTGERSDLSAHFFGFLSGGVLGFLAALLVRKPPRRRALQPLLASTSLAVLLFCWSLALK